MGMHSLCKLYFRLGFTNNEILNLIRTRHNTSTSLRSIKRILNSNNLFRRKKFSSLENVISFIEQQLKTSGQLHGYRWMHLRCRQNGLIVKSNTVRVILKYLDPEGVELRKRKRLRRRQYYNIGPNFLWHLDSYDKLKPYGICINGCIDGFSRYILWLKAAKTNNDPKVVAGYYYNTVNELNGFPRSIRSDKGTENGHIEKMQIFLTEENCSESCSRPPFIYGRSTANQRIESWWGILRKHSAQFWMNLFQEMKENLLFDGTFLDKALMQFCFIDKIQEDLDGITLEWNTHNISSSRNSISSTGKPMLMFSLPEQHGGTRDYINKIVHYSSLTACEEECDFLKYPCDKTVHDLCNLIIAEKSLQIPNNCYEAVDLYNILRNEIVYLLSI